MCHWIQAEIADAHSETVCHLTVDRLGLDYTVLSPCSPLPVSSWQAFYSIHVLRDK
jgi:hypothetical protein